jgi:hypothetical protein
MATIFVAGAALLAGCGDDPVAPQAAAQKVATMDEITVQMSSITAITDCDPSGAGGPGDFYTILIVSKKYEDGTYHEVGRSPEFLMQVNDGETLGAASDLMNPITFQMPRTPGAEFTVEAFIRESDGNGVNSMSQHVFSNHRFDRHDYDTWGSGARDFESYTQLNDGRTVAVYKFATWSNAGDCRGYANYAIYIKPIWE